MATWAQPHAGAGDLGTTATSTARGKGALRRRTAGGILAVLIATIALASPMGASAGDGGSKGSGTTWHKKQLDGGTGDGATTRAAWGS
jgi:hypothetical protein